MLDEGNDLNVMETPDAPPPEEKSNRSFLIVGGIIAGLVFLTLVGMAVYFLVLRPRSTAQGNATRAAIGTVNAQNIQNTALTAQAALWTPTLPTTLLPLPTSTSISKTPTVRSTPVITLNSLAATATADPATLIAMQAQLSLQQTSTAAAAVGTRSAGGQGMPRTGFFDEVGLPSMIILALALVAVIFLARRMRKSPSK